MDILLDTCTFLWLENNSPRVPPSIRLAAEDKRNRIWFSASSAWEIAIKFKLGQIVLPDPPERYIPARIASSSLRVIDIGLSASIRAGSLPLHHKDPFDRMLIAQAEIEGLTIATPDHAFAPYGVPLLW